MNCLTKNVNLYGNGGSLRTSGYSYFMPIQNIIWKMKLQGKFTVKENEC